ncbi:hypothetical protein VC83_01389 [Pseudogymnoascus destructans]|uniref:Uncharacterized protein n=2 Tax=Pseudogymnoascus destructans TaxID=655981 RepID=L8FPE3_PSED2|nr:uncharacterized protein VC83_01389 [Pseudogymnoascus destructans]ELR02343.1 hypothetical protein GMDG_05410 [Pseudogymnoascus destructans 20631-21]OAF61731.2 hypothetical protein VC83_01389 [Pseudogymnoascus destructans]
MVDDGSKRAERPSSSPQAPPPPLDFMDVVSPALQIGSLTGVSGLLFGAVGGVLRSTTPTIFALASGLQWFTLGSTFWATRTILLHELRAETGESARKISASAIAGGVSGGIGGLLRSRKNVIPGSLIFATFGALGQAAYNYADAREGQKGSDKGKEEGKGGWLNSRWSPVKALSDEEYGRILEERLLKLDAEITLVNESIEAVKKTVSATATPTVAATKEGKGKK